MPPNVVFIITDNQGAWTLGCYGNEEIRTPNLDRLAAGGVRFARALCVNPVCSPNRATYLTGLIPSQHGVHNWLGTERPDAQIGPQAYCTIGEFVTLPQILAGAGYHCGLSGKWHLGDSLHPQLGFAYWFTKPRGHTHSFYDDEMIWQGRIYKEPRYATDAITDHAVDFLRRSARRRPFFLYVGYNGPYGLDRDLRTGHRNRHTDYYADKKLACFPREPVHPWLKLNREIINTDVAIRGYAAAVSGIDDGVGTILRALDELGLADDTLVIFTADQGLCAGHHGMWGMGDHSRPLHMFEENLHIPLLLRHPARIPAGGVCETMTCNYDFFPSMLEYLGLEDRRPADADLPGRSYAPALLGRPLDWPEEVTFHEYENTRTAHTREWKYTRRHPSGPDELYDMAANPGERSNLIDSAKHAGILQAMQARLDQFFSRYADAKYDLWQGGTSKAGRMISGE